MIRPDPHSPYTVFESFILALYEPPLRRSATHARMKKVLSEFGEVCPTLADVDALAVPRWLKLHQERAAITNFGMLSTFRTACNLGVHILPGSPFVSRPPRRWFPETDLDEEPRRKFHTEEEVTRILARADAEADADGSTWRARRLRAFAYSLIFLGARRNEILGMRVEDVVFRDRLIHIRPNERRKLKTRASKAILPIPPKLLEVLAWWTPQTRSEWLFPGQRRRGPWLHAAGGYKPSESLKELGERAGVRNFTALSARHTFATLAEGWGWGEAMIQRFLRHTTPITQKGYRHQHLAQMAVAAERIAFGPLSKTA